FADVADNPGGGGRGNTTELLRALINAGAGGVQLGVMFDPALVRDAHGAGVGANIQAHFNREEPSPLSKPLQAPAQVIALTDGRFRATRGVLAGTQVNLGASCLLRIGGIDVAVISIRQQICSAETLEHFGLDPAQARCLVLKSRGHFRAGFAHLVRDENIFEVDAPGLATPNFASLPWRALPRPLYPLDADMEWAGPP
ncbi:MAG TPA: MlrC C-terminal domain-containing protein, partial [Nevskiaceae bacterium]|nr:MlrC C-terminal domain-containing protein [Nevskiaceae bacterium]